MIYLTKYRTACQHTPELLDDILYPQQVHWFKETYARAASGMVYPPHRLADKVLDATLIAELKTVDAGKTAFILAGGNAHFAGLQAPIRSSRLSYAYKMLPLSLTQLYAGRIAQSCNATDYVTTDASACASSLKVLMDVQVLIDHYEFDRVIVLSVEDAVSNLVLEFFGDARASLTHKEQTETGKKPSAFDRQNGGFFVGQGAALAVFESEAGLARSGSQPTARLLGAYAASEPCTNSMGQNPEGIGFCRAAAGAIKRAGVATEDIGIVKTHGTGTESNNIAERAALKSLALDNFVATSFKPSIGHTMGASGLLETLLLLDSIKIGVIPEIQNRTEPDAVFLSEPCQAPKKYILSLAAGMGNVYAAAILSAEV